MQSVKVYNFLLCYLDIDAIGESTADEETIEGFEASFPGYETILPSGFCEPESLSFSSDERFES